MSYACSVCKFRTVSITAFIRHVKIHRNLANIRFQHGYAECPTAFTTVVALQKHMHRFRTPTVKPGLHIESGPKVPCPYDNCSKTFSVRSSFTSHISLKHKKRTCTSSAAAASTASSSNSEMTKTS